MNRRVLIVAAAAAVIVLMVAVANRRPAMAKVIDSPKLDGFIFNEIRFDESMGGQKPTPKVPAGWRFVGVANGNHANCNSLWFQGQDGTVYRMEGFADGGEFILYPHIQVLRPGN